MAKHDNSKIQLGISISRDRGRAGPISLTLDHVSGAFILLAIGCACAMTVFILELLWDQYQKYKAFANNFIIVEPIENA